MEQITEEKIAEQAKRLLNGEMDTMRELKGITDGEMEAVYSLGFNFYNTGRYDEAEKIFKFLVLFDHLNPKYWTAMGALQQVRKDYDTAVTSYSFASFLDLKDPKPQFHAAECFLAKGDVENAKSALEALKKFAPANTERGRLYLSKAEELATQIASREA